MEDKSSSGNATAADNQSTNATPSKKAAKSKAAKSQRPKSSHPPTSEMVNSAIKELKDRKGSSLQAIKKYIASTYKVDGEKLAPFIKRYLKTAVISGAVMQTKGKGASGSFKLSGTPPKGPETKSKSRREVRKTTTEKKPAGAKQVTPKKAAVPKKRAAVKKTAAVQPKKSPSPKKAKTVAAKKAEAAAKQTAVAQTKNLSKTKKATKAPAAKTKIPKPKTAKSPKAAKASAKK
ncbi:uncharacterized protein LOC143372933 [Andrena cerasifolii]|uniref:uncharacterized protein LOC143372933 n=1 Tax=Andrena cerasifolii TaxID=2819439 RepID=UPI004037DA9B